jgi:lactobin A/cerein 7B family class IIb bacteriocin
MKELSKQEVMQVQGGVVFTAIALGIGVVGGLIGTYEFGKAVGRWIKS